MGLYDEITVRCPHCDTIVTLQSKAGECRMRSFCIEDVPVMIMGDLVNKDHWCEYCEKKFKIVVKTKLELQVRKE